MKTKKDKSYIHKVKVIAMADIQCGNKSKLLKSMDDLIKKEDYESCEGIKQAIEESQPYKICMSSDDYYNRPKLFEH